MLTQRMTRLFLSRNQCPRRLQSLSSSSPPATTTTTTTTDETKSPTSLIEPLKARDFFGVHKLFTISDLFQARVHLGHTPRASTSEMRPFIYGRRFDTAIIDLNETALLLRQALNFLAHLSYMGGIVLFVARQPKLVHLVEKTAIEAGEYAHCRKWSHEILTNTKKIFDGEVRFPDVLVFLHTRDSIKYDQHPGIIDAAKMSIPTIGIVDTDCNPNLITYPIPGNDDTLEAQQLYLHLFKQAILLGKKKRQEETASAV